MESLALWIGYIFIILVVGVIIYVFYQWALYGEISQSVSVETVGGDIYVNGKLVAELKGGGNISTINGTVYHNNKIVYKYKKKFRWQK